MLAILKDLLGYGVKFYLSLQLDLRTKFIIEIIQPFQKYCIFQVESYLKRGSGWIVERFHKIDLMVTDYNPISARS